MKRQAIAAITLLMTSMTPGCSGTILRSETDYQPLELTFFQIYQSIDGGILDPRYIGTINFPHCSMNTNPFRVRVEQGFEVYQLLPGTTNRTLKLVGTGPPSWSEPEPNWTTSNLGEYHLVLANETATGGFDYTIHVWDQILHPRPEDANRLNWTNPTPLDRRDLWHNITFTPFGDQTHHAQGDWERCGMGRPPG